MDNFIRCLAFPANLAAGLFWLSGCVLLWKEPKASRIVRFMLSPSAVISSISAFCVCCIWVGLTGDRDFVRTWIFALVFLYLMTVLLFVLLRGWKTATGRIRYRFILNHAGLLLALGASFWGFPDNYELRVGLRAGESSAVAYSMDGERVFLDEAITLVGISSQKYEDGSPMRYSASLLIGDRESVISVNHPCSSGISENIYLSSVEGDSCILQIVHEPWRYFALAGIIMLLAGALMLFIGGPQR